MSGFGRKKLKTFSFEWSSPSKKLSTEILITELNYVLMKKSEFKHPAKTILFAVSGLQGS